MKSKREVVINEKEEGQCIGVHAWVTISRQCTAAPVPSMCKVLPIGMRDAGHLQLSPLPRSLSEPAETLDDKQVKLRCEQGLLFEGGEPSVITGWCPSSAGLALKASGGRRV